jgi:hypothetical protein
LKEKLGKWVGVGVGREVKKEDMNMVMDCWGFSRFWFDLEIKNWLAN